MVAYTMKDIRRLGIEEVVKRAIEHVSPKYVKMRRRKQSSYAA